MKKYVLVFLILVTGISSCTKDTFDPEKQAAQDEQSIKNFIAANNIQGAIRHSSGLYYVVTAPGTGSVSYTANTNVTTKYTGRLLNGEIFDMNSAGVTFALGGVIVGWQIGIQFIQKGGSIRLLIPSALAYGNNATGSIPANSVLDFTIELVNVN